jgi:hypothetical protein
MAMVEGLNMPKVLTCQYYPRGEGEGLLLFSPDLELRLDDYDEIIHSGYWYFANPKNGKEIPAADAFKILNTLAK